MPQPELSVCVEFCLEIFEDKQRWSLLERVEALPRSSQVEENWRVLRVHHENRSRKNRTASGLKVPMPDGRLIRSAPDRSWMNESYCQKGAAMPLSDAANFAVQSVDCVATCERASAGIHWSSFLGAAFLELS